VVLVPTERNGTERTPDAAPAHDPDLPSGRVKQRPAGVACDENINERKAAPHRAAAREGEGGGCRAVGKTRTALHCTALHCSDRQPRAVPWQGPFGDPSDVIPIVHVITSGRNPRSVSGNGLSSYSIRVLHTSFASDWTVALCRCAGCSVEVAWYSPNPAAVRFVPGAGSSGSVLSSTDAAVDGAILKSMTSFENEF
jgi:hypothetical protein